MSTAIEQFEALNGRVVSLDEIQQVLDQAKKENNTDLVYRLSRALEDCKDETRIEVNIKKYPNQLNAPRHTGDYREALDDCGRLRKGWKFVKGNVVKVEKKEKKEVSKLKKQEIKNTENQEETFIKYVLPLYEERKANPDKKLSVKESKDSFFVESKEFWKVFKNIQTDYIKTQHLRGIIKILPKGLEMLEKNCKTCEIVDKLQTKLIFSKMNGRGKESSLKNRLNDLFGKEITLEALFLEFENYSATKYELGDVGKERKVFYKGLEFSFWWQNESLDIQISQSFTDFIFTHIEDKDKALFETIKKIIDKERKKKKTTKLNVNKEQITATENKDLAKKSKTCDKSQDKSNEIQILKTSSKGAMLITDGNNVAWIMKKQRRSDGTFTEGALKSLQEGEPYSEEKHGNIAERDRQRAEEKENLQNNNQHEITFYSDYKLGTNRFAITDENGEPLWYGKDFDDPSSQAQGELNAGKKAVWLAGKVREMFDLPSIKLTLNVDAQWLTYQSNAKQKGYELTRLAEKYNVVLNAEWVSGKDNPADEYTTKNASGYKKWSDVSIDEFRVLVKQESGLSGPCEGLTKREISKMEKEETEKVLKRNVWDFSDMPDALIQEIRNWKIISKSPYSHSYYNDACKSWNYTTEGSLRVSDHWNFVSRGETHCPTDVEVKNGNWILAQYKNGVYHVIKDYGRASISEMKKRDELEDIYRAFIEHQTLKEREEKLNKIAKTIKSLGIKIENYKDTKKDKTKLWDDIKNAFIKKKKPQMTLVKGIYTGSGSRSKRVGSEKFFGTLTYLTNEFATIDKNITSKEFSFDNEKIRDLFKDLKYNHLDVFRKYILEKKVPKKTKEKNSLSAPNPLIIPMNTELPEVELFNIGGDFGQFLGSVERKPVGSVAITLDAPQGAGKTRFLFYAMDQIAGAGYRCLFVSLEEHPMSELFQQKKEKYIDPQNLHLIDTIGELPNGYDDLKDVIDHYDWIFIDSWGKLSEITPVDFDRDFRKKYNGKGLFVIFQRTVNNTMRGGSRFQFDGDIIMKIHKDKEGDFKNNYAYFDKNRYQSTELHLLKFNTYTHKLMTDEEV